MSSETLIINKLMALKVSHAIDSLEQPSRKDNFEYGERIGVMKGINLSIQIIEQLIDELKKTDE